MRRLAQEIGIQAPSLYKHFADKSEITTAVHIDYLIDHRDALQAALDRHPSPDHAIVRMAYAFREFAGQNRSLHLFSTTMPYPRDQVPELLRSIRLLWLKAAGDENLATAIWSFTSGMVSMDFSDRFPPGTDTDGAFAAGLDAFVDHADGREAQGAARTGGRGFRASIGKVSQ